MVVVKDTEVDFKLYLSLVVFVSATYFENPRVM